MESLVTVYKLRDIKDAKNKSDISLSDKIKRHENDLNFQLFCIYSYEIVAYIVSFLAYIMWRGFEIVNKNFHNM